MFNKNWKEMEEQKRKISDRGDSQAEKTQVQPRFEHQLCAQIFSERPEIIRSQFWH